MLRLSVLALVFLSASGVSAELAAQTSFKVDTNAGSPHPTWALSGAPINRMVKKRIVAHIADSFGDDYQFNARDFTGSFVKLNATGRIGILLLPPDKFCGATANCQVWVFDGKTGVELVSDNGWDYGLRKTMHHGVYDFYMRHNMSCCTGTLHEYRFDGKVYKLARSIDETTQ